jgi:DNA-binding HxlR family transcriptional regulator
VYAATRASRSRSSAASGSTYGELLAGPLRFGDLRAQLDNVSAKTLTDRLRALEHHGILTRTIYPEIPPRVVYELTEQGESLRPVLHAMLRWGRANPA